MNLHTPQRTSPSRSTPALPLAILFDMDGTLTQPLLDFPRIKAEMGIGNHPILEAMTAMTTQARAKAEEVLLRHELHASENSALNEGCRELLDWVHAQHIPTALITRNSRASAKTVCRMHSLHFDVLITREDGRFKPHPEPLLRACDRLGVAPFHSWMVGDGQYDVEAGLSAGAKTVWISHHEEKSFAAEPWKTVPTLPDLTRLLEGCLI